MGLDMYLNAKHSLFAADWSANPLADKINAVLRKHLEAEGSSFPIGTVNLNIGSQIEISAAYWRKANAIHGWFVDNVQDGTDDCGSYYVSRDTLAGLRDLCQRILDGDQAAREELQPRGGFFFGPTDDDEWYLENVKATVDQINAALTLPGGWEFEYTSSW